VPTTSNGQYPKSGSGGGVEIRAKNSRNWRVTTVSTASGPSFVFDDIENTPIVRHRKSLVDSYSCVFVDANQEEDEAPSPQIPVPAGPGDCIEVKFISSIEAYSILGLEIGAEMQAGTKSQLAVFTIVSTWNVHNEASSFSEAIQSPKLCAKRRTMKPGDTVVELKPTFGDTLEEYLHIVLYRDRRVVSGEAIRHSLLYQGELLRTESSNQLFAPFIECEM
jgi:hypothetical protein